MIWSWPPSPTSLFFSWCANHHGEMMMWLVATDESPPAFQKWVLGNCSQSAVKCSTAARRSASKKWFDFWVLCNLAPCRLPGAVVRGTEDWLVWCADTQWTSCWCVSWTLCNGQVNEPSPTCDVDKLSFINKFDMWHASCWQQTSKLSMRQTRSEKFLTDKKVQHVMDELSSSTGASFPRSSTMFVAHTPVQQMCVHDHFCNLTRVQWSFSKWSHATEHGSNWWFFRMCIHQLMSRDQKECMESEKWMTRLMLKSPFSLL